MRLHEVERGDSLIHRALIGLISLTTRMRLPDAARVALYHRDFSRPLGTWTQATMRGPSPWTVGERELMAAVVARWNSCTFCLGAHRAIATKELSPAVVAAVLADFRTAPIGVGLKVTLAFLETLTLSPERLTPDAARSVLLAGVSAEALADAIAVASLFAIITRYADALDFEIPTPEEFDRAGDMLFKRGYAR